MKDLPLKQMDEEEKDNPLIDQDKYRKNGGKVYPIDSDKGRIPQKAAEMESDIEKFVGRDREPVSDTVKYRKPINERQGRVSDFYDDVPAQGSIQK